MAKRNTPVYDPRRIWSRNLAPLARAAREGASHAAHTASKERERARRKSQWWRQRWLYATAAGLVVAGAAGGVYQAVTKRREGAPDQPAGTDREAAAGKAVDAIRSTVDTGRERVSGAARNAMHKIRRDGEPDRPDSTAGAPDPTTRSQASVTGGGAG